MTNFPLGQSSSRKPGDLAACRALGAAVIVIGFHVQACSDDSASGGGSPDPTGGSNVGGGSASECDTSGDCPDTGSECVVRICLDHQCGTLDAAYGTPLKTQVAGDCVTAVCDGTGAEASLPSVSDIVLDDSECTVDECTASGASHAPKVTGSPCFAVPGGFCDGAGSCVQCVGSEDCADLDVCVDGYCVPPTCTDTVTNGDETDVDCGGACAPCALEATCLLASDCSSGLCAAGVCSPTAPIINDLSANGHDRSFNVAFDGAGRIVTVGVSAPGTEASTDYSTVVARYSAQGTLDASFGSAGVFTKNLATGANGELARALGFQSSGKIIVGATVEHAGAADPRDRDVALFRLLQDGTLDTSFGDDGVKVLDLSAGVVVGNSFLADSMWHLVVQPDDKIVFSAGKVRSGGTDTDYAMVRVDADGELDPSFAAGGVFSLDIQETNASARSLTLLPNGSLLGAGYRDVAGVGLPMVYRVDGAGNLDTTFGTGGYFSAPVLAAQTEAYSIVPQGNKLVTTGYGRANATTESLDWLSLRFLANGTLDPTYGTAGVARIDIGGFNDQTRQIVVLPDQRVLLAGGGRLTANDVDGAIAMLTPSGQPDVSFSPSGVRTIDLGAGNDFLWGMALSPDQHYLALSGIRGVAVGAPGNDATALVLLPLP